MKNVLKILGINAAILAAGLILVELAFGGWISGTDPLLNFTRPRNVDWRFDVPWDPDGALYSRDKYGLRGLKGSPSDITILTMGGSTTDQRYLADGTTWQDAMEQAFEKAGDKVDVVNAGIDGQSTVGHMHNFDQWIVNIPDFSARYILFYVGVNDFYVEDGGQYDSDLLRDDPLREFANRSALVTGAKILRDLLRSRGDGAVDMKPGHSFGGADTSTYVNTRALAECCTDAKLVAGMTGLGKRIERLAGLAREAGAEPVFVTQRTALWQRRDGQIYGAPSLSYAPPSILADLGPITGVDRYDIEAFQARTVMQACEAAKAICIDLFSEIDFDLQTDFYDSVHNTPHGAARIGTFLHEKLVAAEPAS